jgi:hypothetical protein
MNQRLQATTTGEPQSGRGRPAVTLLPQPASDTAAAHGGAMQAMLVPLLTVELLLLAFFILLNAVSTLETDRTRSVLDSVRAAFGLSTTQQVEQDLGDPEKSLAEVEQQIASLARAVGAAPAPAQEDALWIDLPVDALFRPGEDRLNPAQAQFVERLTALLSQTPAGYAYEAAVLRGGGEVAAGDAGLRLRQSAALAAALRSRVEPRGRIAAGLLPDAAVGMRIALSWRTPEAGDR